MKETAPCLRRLNERPVGSSTRTRARVPRPPSRTRRPRAAPSPHAMRRGAACEPRCSSIGGVRCWLPPPRARPPPEPWTSAPAAPRNEPLDRSGAVALCSAEPVKSVVLRLEQGLTTAKRGGAGPPSGRRGALRLHADAKPRARELCQEADDLQHRADFPALKPRPGLVAPLNWTVASCVPVCRKRSGHSRRRPCLPDGLAHSPHLRGSAVRASAGRAGHILIPIAGDMERILVSAGIVERDDTNDVLGVVVPGGGGGDRAGGHLARACPAARRRRRARRGGRS